MWRSSWLHATSRCINGLLAAPEENQSFTHALLLFYGFGLENSSRTVSRFAIYLYIPNLCEWTRRSIHKVRQNMFCNVFIHSSLMTGLSCKLLQRGSAVKNTETQPIHHKLLNSSAQATMSPHRLASGLPFNSMKGRVTYQAETAWTS